jgi:hypothetical protein
MNTLTRKKVLFKSESAAPRITQAASHGKPPRLEAQTASGMEQADRLSQFNQEELRPQREPTANGKFAGSRYRATGRDPVGTSAERGLPSIVRWKHENVQAHEKTRNTWGVRGAWESSDVRSELKR